VVVATGRNVTRVRDEALDVEVLAVGVVLVVVVLAPDTDLAVTPITSRSARRERATPSFTT